MHEMVGIWRYALYALLLYAAVRDIRAFIIPNFVSIAALAVLAAAFIASGAAPEAWKNAAISGAIALAIGYALFAAGLMGAGDGKLFAATAAWFAPVALLELGFMISVAGCILSVAALAFAALRRNRDRPLLRTKIPYGVAIAAGAIIAGGL
jgi:prepilin peptidase CpaA